MREEFLVFCSGDAVLLGGVEEAEEAALAAEGVDAGEELLHAVEGWSALEREECFAALVAGVEPEAGDGGGIGGGVADVENAEACFGEELFIVARRSEEVVADGTAGGDLVVRDDAADDERVAEKKARLRLENAMRFPRASAKRPSRATEDAGGVAVRRARLVGEGELPRGVALLEADTVSEIAGLGEMVGVDDAGVVDIDTDDSAADGVGELQRVAA